MHSLSRARRPLAASAAALLLAGCATVDIDREIGALNDSLPGFTQGALARQTEPRAQAQRAAADALLAQPLALDVAVRLALVNSPGLQALLAERWGEMAQAEQSGRIANPVFSFERMRSGSELEIGRMLSLGLLDLLTWPQRQAVARNQVAQARVQLAASVVDQVSQVRQAWVRAVAAQQLLAYAGQVGQAADASAQLARQMQRVGNFSTLERARQQAFQADATGRLAAARHAATATREELVRLLGLDDAQASRLQLPDRLPDLPDLAKELQTAPAQALREQRLDWQLARLQLDAAGRAQGLDLLSSLVDTELGLRRDTHFNDATGERATARGFELSLRLPLFDWGAARRAAMNAQSLAAAHHYEAVTRGAASQWRQAASARRTAWEIARHHRDEVVPLRRTISDENLLRYNGMQIGVFELLADAREQIASVMAAIDAQQQFWLADAALAATLVGRPQGSVMSISTSTPSAAAAPAH